MVFHAKYLKLSVFIYILAVMETRVVHRINGTLFLQFLKRTAKGSFMSLTFLFQKEIEGWEWKRSKCFFTYIHLDLFRSHPSININWRLGWTNEWLDRLLTNTSCVRRAKNLTNPSESEISKDVSSWFQQTLWQTIFFQELANLPVNEKWPK